jgi:hypothetical protein
MNELSYLNLFEKKVTSTLHQCLTYSGNLSIVHVHCLFVVYHYLFIQPFKK